VIAIVDYGAGNLASVARAFAAVGADVRLVRTPQEAGDAAGIVVPGVGHFAATAALGDEWRAAIRRHVEAGAPLLGICLGMQWLFESSTEAPGCPGLALLGGSCRRLSAAQGQPGSRLKVPHVGWNLIRACRPSKALAGLAPQAYVYFTHSYAAPVGDACVAVTVHGDPFAAVVERGNVWGTQFHPEKSADAGLRILRNFVEAC
jgi:glutamine amidotransferase